MAEAAPTTERRCPVCGKRLQRHPKEKASSFRNRRFCGKSCSGRSAVLRSSSPLRKADRRDLIDEDILL